MLVIERNLHLGDALMAATIVAILNDNNIPAALKTDRTDVLSYVDVPIWNETTIGIHYNWRYESFYPIPPNYSFVSKTLDHLTETYHLKPIKFTRNCVPVNFTYEDVPKYDIAIGTKTSNWTIYRNWPYFKELKTLLDKEKITWIDMDEENIYGNTCLNIVNNSKLYLGLETGRSHYVSIVANGKTLILQSGYCLSNTWSIYDYKFLDLKVDCSPCYLQNNCKFNHKCMANIKPEIVLAKILELINY